MTNPADGDAGRQFPDDFVWGVSTAAYQIEGGAVLGGRGWSIWDAFSHTPGKTLNGDTGDVADDHYHRYKEDIAIMASAGIKHYRFSISWPRIQPNGHGPANPEGVAFYNGLIDALLGAGIQPLPTLYHWDLPLTLQVEEDGWLAGAPIADAFAAYARICFDAFGDRVTRWLTFNEPWCSAVLGFGTGEHAPGRSCEPGREPYVAAHTILLAHAKAAKVYREDFKARQGGVIGITLNCDWREPKPDDDQLLLANNCAAAERALEFHLGWFADPLYFGDYPAVMKARCGDRLPAFTDEEKALIKESSDFFGLNHYSTDYCEDLSPDSAAAQMGDYFSDVGVFLSADPSWKKTDMGWNVVPWGIRKLLLWIQQRYSPPGGIVVTENGCAVREETKAVAQVDQDRVDYLQGYIGEVHAAMEQGADCRGYYCWSFMDNFEWALGYSKRFGLCWVDYDTLERTPKLSLKWYTGVIGRNAV